MIAELLALQIRCSDDVSGSMRFRPPSLPMDSVAIPTRRNSTKKGQAVEESGHRIFIELITDKERSSNVAAETVFERFDPTGRMHSIRVRLFIPTIDRAYGGEQPPREGLEFIPFAGLRHETRYAKVPGHELAHIEKALRDPDYLVSSGGDMMEQSSIDAGVGAEGHCALTNRM